MVIRAALHRIKNKLKDVYVKTIIRINGKPMVCEVEGDGKNTTTVCTPLKKKAKKKKKR